MSDFELLNDLPYGAAGRFLLFLDLYRPDPPPESPLPAVIYIHGGGWWRRGDKALRQPPMLVESGRYIVASINYRLSGQAVFPAQLHDCKAAVRFLRANAEVYGIDPGRIGAWGYSAGGQLAALLGLTGGRPELEGDGGAPGQSSAIQAVVSVAAPSDLARLGGWHDEDGSPTALLLGGPPSDLVDQARAASPLAYAAQPNPAQPPFLLIHGDADDQIPPEQSLRMHEALLAGGRPSSTLLRIAGAGHSFAAGTAESATATAAIQEFFDANL